MAALQFRHVSETSLVGLLTDAKGERRKFKLENCHGVIILSHLIRRINLMKAETVEDLETRRETSALLTALRIEVTRETF